MDHWHERHKHSEQEQESGHTPMDRVRRMRERYEKQDFEAMAYKLHRFPFGPPPGFPSPEGWLNRGQFGGPQTFRRGKLIDFLERLIVKRNTLKQQLDQPEYAALQQLISGQLMAVDSVINEYVQAFDLAEYRTDMDVETQEEDKKEDQSKKTDREK